jgi:hypothetical protein
MDFLQQLIHHLNLCLRRLQKSLLDQGTIEDQLQVAQNQQRYQWCHNPLLDLILG